MSDQKDTWTKWNLIAETERQLRHYRFPFVDDRDTVTNLVAARAVDPEVSMASPSRTRPSTHPELRRASGECVFTEHRATRYTTKALLDAEQRLVTTARQHTRYGLPETAITEMIGSFERRYDIELEGQRALVQGFAGHPRRLVVGIGPAGAGKTTAMRAVAAAWSTTGRRVVPLAPSAAAAEVLASELGCRAENLHKFQHAHENLALYWKIGESTTENRRVTSGESARSA